MGAGVISSLTEIDWAGMASKVRCCRVEGLACGAAGAWAGVSLRGTDNESALMIPSIRSTDGEWGELAVFEALSNAGEDNRGDFESGGERPGGAGMLTGLGRGRERVCRECDVGGIE
jgi:hypothetical protein